MIAVDTNVLLRYLLDDDPQQSARAAELIEGTEPVLLTDVVLVEALWTLRGRKYQLDKAGLMAVVQALFQEPGIRFEDGQAVWTALNDYRKAKTIRGKSADFADALIINKARSAAQLQNIPFNGSYTFDKAAQRLPGAKAPKST